MSSVAGEMDGSCEKCGHPYAMPHRPIENPKGGGPGTEKVPNTGKAQAKYNSSTLKGAGGGKPAESAAKMPGKVSGTTFDGAGGGESKRGAKTATEKPEDAIWQPSATWEMSASDEPDEEY